MIECLRTFGFTGEIKVIEWPEEIKDPNGLHLRCLGDPGGFEAELVELVEQAGVIDLNGRQPDQESDDTTPLSEDALALGFASRHRDDLRFVAASNRWYSWTEVAWREDRILAVYDRARAFIRDAAKPVRNKRQRADLRKARTVNAIVTLARSDPRLVIVPEILDAEGYLLNTPGGVVDLHTGEMREHRRGDYCTKLTAVAPADKADCPRWLAFLEQIFTREEPKQTADLIGYMKRLLGYSLTGDTRESVISFAYGGGGNGKTTLKETAVAILGDYARAVPAETFLWTKNERHPTEIANLAGARFVTAAEIAKGRVWHESRLKELTGGDKLSARYMRGDFFEFVPIFKLLIIGNHKPSLRSVDEAFRRRFHLIPFTITIPEKQRNDKLREELRAELPAILRWMIDGCIQWQRQKLSPPPEVNKVTEDYLRQEDAVGRWLEERTDDDAQAETSTDSLYRNYREWAEEGREFVLSKRGLSDSLEERGYARYRTGSERGFHGLELKLWQGNAKPESEAGPTP